jgi:hypothetical protein
MKFIYSLVILLVLLINPVLAQIKTEECEKLNFHFIVLSNESYMSFSRTVFVFLDEKAFNENNLRNLFAHLSKQYADKKRLSIVVWANWEQLPLPFDCSPAANRLSDTSDQKPNNFDFHEATYYKDEKAEYFRYNPVLKTDNFKTVVIKKN